MNITPTNNNQSPYSNLLQLPSKLEDCAQKIVESINKQGLLVGKQIDGGAQGVIFPLCNTSNGKISSVLKITAPGNYGITPFDPEQGAHLVANLKHPNLCTPTQFFYLTPSSELAFKPTAGSTCIGTIMPFIQKGSTSYKVAPIFNFGKKITGAIQELAKNGLEHRDLHSGNILIDPEGNPHVIDFDLCAKKTKPIGLREYDYEQLRKHLIRHIMAATDIEPNAQTFLVECVGKATEEQLLSSTFMQNCLDHLEEIEIKPNSVARPGELATALAKYAIRGIRHKPGDAEQAQILTLIKCMLNAKTQKLNDYEQAQILALMKSMLDKLPQNPISKL
jgi:serine/threonine protein kinase